MTYVLENNALYLECTEDAGQILHLKKNGTEIMYQGDQGWSGRNPTLFPIVGNTYDGTYTIDGKTYAMKNHGLIRYAKLTGEKVGDSLVFSLSSNPETLAQYPFDFHYEIAYTLENNQVHVDYKIQNTGKVDMPFGFGLHPAFLLRDKFSNYHVSFDGNTNLEQLHMYEHPAHWEPITTSGWQLNRADLEHFKTMIYRGLKSKTITLWHKDEPYVRLHVSDYPYLALWSHPTPSDFICLEPWYSHADFDPVKEDFYHREGTMILKPDQTWTMSYTIEV